MHPALADLITRFRTAQDRGVAALGELLRVPLPGSNRQWPLICAERGLDRLRGVDGVGVYAHGYGVELAFDGLTIDFDFGDAGEPDGFDAWRLWNFARSNAIDVTCEYAHVKRWLEEAERAGELTRDSSLYYSPAHRAGR